MGVVWSEPRRKGSPRPTRGFVPPFPRVLPSPAERSADGARGGEGRVNRLACWLIAYLVCALLVVAANQPERLPVDIGEPLVIERGER